jgi:hypothetical protein
VVAGVEHQQIDRSETDRRDDYAAVGYGTPEQHGEQPQ